ncbi:hypothetical protein [uncultured Treponema sp.]|uniref:hypothetical protein n=1 Tax=uncultured Treponema sp. TaxID=162155 RepID=UPI0025F6FCA1|nr:hypothetical protein [uncultured Treponema sp.]
MAKFNTLAGGYYGKLGATVGQRWKNIRTVRAYVVPHNPQTEVQQANRKRFSDCVFYAQLAGQMNAKVTAFDTTSKTLWNARMSTARALQDLNYSEMDRLPLYPTSFSVPNIISAATITQVVDETHIQVTVEGIAPTEERVLTMLLLLPGAESWKDRLALCIGSNGEEGGNIFTFRLPEGLTIPNGTKARFVSCDDTDSLTDLIASAQIDLPIAAPEHHTFDTSITSVERSGNNFTFTFGEDYQSGDNSITVASLKGVVNGAITTISNPTVSLINNGGKFAMVYTSEATDSQDLIAFPAGSEVVISAIKSWSSTVHADAENATESFSSTDLTRTYKNTINGYQRNESIYRFRISRSLPEITSKSGAVRGRAVLKGAISNLLLTGYTLGTNYLEWNSGVTASENLPAFPSGSTITMETVIIGNGVTYNPERTTAQAITSTDLTRTMSPLTFSWSTTSQKWEATFNDLATITSGGGNRSVTVKNHNFVNQLSKTASITVGYSGGKITVSGADYDNSTILLASDMSSLPQAENFVASGVTYTLAAQQFTAVKNGVQTLDSSDWNYSGNIGMDGFGFYLELADYSDVSPNTAPGGLTLVNPSDVEIGEEGGNVFTVTIDSANVIMSSSHDDVEITFEANCEGAGRTEGEDATISLSGYPMYITDGNNRWQLASIDVDLTSND